MPALNGDCANNRDGEAATTVLVLTDGSDKARRITDWGLMFTDVDRIIIQFIEIVERLDSGVIIRRYEETVHSNHAYQGRRPTGASTSWVNQIQEYNHVTDVLHGVPHDALLDYIATNAIDLIVIGIGDRTRSSRSLIGETLITVSRIATIPVMTLGKTKTP